MATLQSLTAESSPVFFQEDLYFGRNIGVTEKVTESQFRDFLRDVVTERFPDGLTVYDAKGQFRSETGEIIREKSKVVTLLHPNDLSDQREINQIINRYQRRFQQESVLRVSNSDIAIAFDESDDIIDNDPTPELIQVNLYFGQKIGETGQVTDQQFCSFLDQVVTPEFPDGLTVTDADGQFLDSQRQLIREPSKVVTLVLEDTEQNEQAIDQIVRNYKEQFQQQSVLEVVNEEVKVGFGQGEDLIENDATPEMIRVDLYLGRNIGTTEGVTEQDFRLFLKDAVTPRFPDGLTVYDADGQFLDSQGRTIKERSKVISLIVSDTQESERLLGEIIDEYKNRFQQESVLQVVDETINVAFGATPISTQIRLVGENSMDSDRSLRTTREGTDENDLLIGDANNNRLSGEAGDDTIQGKAGDDRLSGNDGQDILKGNTGADTLSGGSQNDRMFGGTGEDQIAGGSGDDQLRGSSGDDQLIGGEGNDLVIGGQDSDRMIGGNGDDILLWNDGEGSDTISGGEGRDLVGVAGAFAAGDNFVLRTIENQALFERTGLDGQVGEQFTLTVDTSEIFEVLGLGGNDTFIVNDLAGTGVEEIVFSGDTGNDVLDASASNTHITANGGDGNDILTGGTGTVIVTRPDNTTFTLGDTLTGGAGQDKFQFFSDPFAGGAIGQNVNRPDVITDYEIGQDQLVFSPVQFGIDTLNLQIGNAAQLVGSSNLVVLTDSFANAAAAAKAIADNPNFSGGRGIFIYFNTNLGHSRVVVSEDLANNGRASILANLTNQTNPINQINFSTNDFTLA